MRVVVNGKPMVVPDECSLEMLISQLDLTPQGVAAAVNREVIPRSVRCAHMLQSSDTVEIIQAAGGG
jgi:thiamine biosynthesis protein ThiS